MKLLILTIFVLSFEIASAQSTPQATRMRPVEATPISIMPSSPMDMNNFVVAGTSTRSESAPFIINVHLNCTRGSLAADYPVVTSTSTVGFHFSVRPGSGSITVRFPANYAAKFDAATNPTPYMTIDSSNILGPGRTGVRAAIAGNLLRIEVPASQVAIDPSNPPANLPRLADDFYFQSYFGANAQNTHLAGGPPGQWVPQKAYDHLYQGPTSYSADLEITLPAGTSDPEKAPLFADFVFTTPPSPRRMRTNVLDCRGAIAP